MKELFNRLSLNVVKFIIILSTSTFPFLLKININRVFYF